MLSAQPFRDHRGAPRLRRGATSVGGLGAISGPPCYRPSRLAITEARHGSAGARRALGVWGPSRGPHVIGPAVPRSPRRATAPPGRDERWGFGGHLGAPMLSAQPSRDHQGAPRLRRGATSVGGLGAISGPPCYRPSRLAITEARHGSAGARRALGVWGPSRGPHVISILGEGGLPCQSGFSACS